MDSMVGNRRCIKINLNKKGSFSMYVDDAPLKSDYADNPYLEFRKSLKDKIKVIIPFEKISKNVNDDLKNHLFNLV